jgi:uncharacterized protein YndB with AHSA1/START domain
MAGSDRPERSEPRDPARHFDVRRVGDRQIVMTRRFAAPPALVFDALVTPALLLGWMHGPPGWRMVDCEVDATEGGHYWYMWHGPDGESMTAEGVIQQIARPARLVVTERFDDNWTGGEVTSVFELAGDGDGTVLTNTSTYTSRSARDAACASGMERGVEASYAHLDRVLADQTQGVGR